MGGQDENNPQPQSAVSLFDMATSSWEVLDMKMKCKGMLVFGFGIFLSTW